MGELAAALGERAEVRLAAELFPDAGPRLQARLADVCVLPAPGRMAWLQRLSRRASCASRATTAGSRRRSRRPGSASCRHELRRQLHRARARLGGALRLAPPRARRHDLRPQPDHPAPRPARPHPPPHDPGGGLPRPGGHAHARLRGRGARSWARASSPAWRRTCAATSPTGTPRTCCCSRSAARVEHVGRDGEAFAAGRTPSRRRRRTCRCRPTSRSRAPSLDRPAVHGAVGLDGVQRGVEVDGRVDVGGDQQDRVARPSARSPGASAASSARRPARPPRSPDRRARGRPYSAESAFRPASQTARVPLRETIVVRQASASSNGRSSLS